MRRSKSQHRIADKAAFLNKALHRANRFDQLAYFSHHHITCPHGGFREILAFGARELCIPQPKQNHFDAIRRFHQGDWLFGFLSYDLKNEVEHLTSQNTDRLGFPKMGFFKAENILFFDGNQVEIESNEPKLFEQIQEFEPEESVGHFGPVQAGMSREEYLATVQKLKEHIEEGDCYEINLCQEFHGQIHQANPVSLFLKLSQGSPKPFACFQKWGKQYILSASPERFLKKQATQLISQPMKGTRPRGNTEKQDQLLKHELRHDEKELAENMMIVDLVRNDLARSAEIGSVKLEEAFGIYSFEQVHQMVSTISARLKPETHFTEAIKNAFPMGSMTGAPKVKAMQLIEQYEKAKRGPFSGAAGYISPEGDFDFNVLIRSLFLNLENATYSFQAGSAITYDALPEKEFEECLLKARAICQCLISR